MISTSEITRITYLLRGVSRVASCITVLAVWEGELSGRRLEERSERLKVERWVLVGDRQSNNHYLSEWDLQDSRAEEVQLADEKVKQEAEAAQKKRVSPSSCS